MPNKFIGDENLEDYVKSFPHYKKNQLKKRIRFCITMAIIIAICTACVWINLYILYYVTHLP